MLQNASYYMILQKTQMFPILQNISMNQTPKRFTKHLIGPTKNYACASSSGNASSFALSSSIISSLGLVNLSTRSGTISKIFVIVS